ncbi:MAG: histidine kinase [Lachnospiraceae bacterium]|nr:histidine kinase [Lachnospiraceae bacterium]
MKKWKDRIAGLKLNIKFTLVIILLVTIPIGVLAGIIFYNMEQNVVNENVHYMQYTMERNRDNIQTSIDSLNMSTQFFISDAAMKEVLEDAVSGKKMSTGALFNFYNTDIAALERLVNNNPLLYSVRVYAKNDNVQEMLPVLYQHSRMEKQAWAVEEDYEGYNFGYTDRIFSEDGDTDSGEKLLSLVTDIEDYGYGTIGTVEASMKLQTIFPSLYEDIENEWSCFISNRDGMLFSDNETEDAAAFVQSEMEKGLQTDDIATLYEKSKGRNLIVSCMYIRELDGTLFSVQDITENIQQVYHMRTVFIVSMLLILTGVGFLVNLTVKLLLRRFYQILASIRKVQAGNLDIRMEAGGTDEMGELARQINKMLDRIKQLTDDNLKRELLVKNSEIRALQNQINAHFIYNVLESIKMMAEIDEEYAISDAITSLGKLLRYSMKWVSGNVLVEDELEYIKNYLALINLRVDYEIYLSLNIPDIIKKQEIPKMSLQPIVENAIYHGIEQMAEDTNIYIKGLFDGNDCIIEITDAGKGMTEEELDALRKKIAGEMETGDGSGHGIGLKNVQDRLHISFGDGYGLQIASMLGCYTKVMVRIPLKNTEN